MDANRKAHNPFQKSPFQPGTAEPRRNHDAFGGFSDESRIALNPTQPPLPSRAYNKPPSFNPPPQIAQVLDNPLAKLGYEISKNKLNNMMESAEGVYRNFMFNDSTRAYFAVDQETILRKMLFSVFPFAIERRSDDAVAELSETYRPELYLPLMSLITFVMLSALRRIFNGHPIHPTEVVNDVISCLMLTFFEALLEKMALFFGAGLSVPYFDLVGVTGYKYVGFPHQRHPLPPPRLPSPRLRPPQLRHQTLPRILLRRLRGSLISTGPSTACSASTPSSVPSSRSTRSGFVSCSF